MASKSIIGTIRSTELEQNLGSTVIGEYVSKIDKIILGIIQSSEIAIPTLGYILDEIPEIKDRLTSIYDMNMGLQEGVQNIPIDLKLSQGALFDSLCFGYDTSDDSYALYTMNFNLLNILGNIGIDMGKQCIEKNIKGEVKCYRIDVEYNNSPDSFSFKAVNHRKKIDDDDNGVILVPYIVVVRFMKILESVLSSGAVINVIQDLGSEYKDRCISKNIKILKMFCDNEDAVSDVRCSFFPLKAFFYAPVLGAPSTTSMVTNVNIFKLCELKNVRRVSQLKSMGIEKPSNPIESIISEQAVISLLMKIKQDNPMKFMDLLDNFPNSENVFKDIENANQVSDGAISKYLHSINDKDKVTLINLIPDCKESINSRMSVFTDCKYAKLQLSELDTIRDVLKNHVCRIIIRKNDCSLSSVTCTNNQEILKRIYGDNYFSLYESFGARLNKVIEDVECGRDLNEALSYYGFVLTKEQVSEISNILSNCSDAYSDTVKKSIADIMGIRTRSSSSKSNDDIILVRTISAYITENGVIDYYRNIDKSKIVDVLILK